MKFPELEGSNLEKKLFNLPNDLQGRLNIIIIAFKRTQQSDIDEWRFYLSEKIQEEDDIHIYEIPTLSYSYRFMRFMIDGGMRSGIPDREIRDHTITLYLNKNSFKKALDIKSEDKIHLLLLDNEGNIFWRDKGKFYDKKMKELLKTLHS
ncbi:MAG: hypothetical protein GF311_11110 [Candidatus Lokiarchaeota archaeon]|nr:hypothetical protein [Candidatus Lokiarchaeota archaeon]